ncbi:Tetraspanin-32 [Cricetulus griseus]|uniref:Tetraspanin-32 n=1 Tax=Cricetulus griseus TaxID=10029 RepID=G3HXZ4_CRIGR|nr:Tetraspanin-32 [Cricetulus griseus]
MEHWKRIKIAKCQILITNFFVLLLALSMVTMAVVTHFGDHLTVIGHVSLERNPYEAMHYWAFYMTISLACLLSLSAALSTIATVREAHGLMAAVEDAVLDTYDLVYDQAMKRPSSSWWQELATIQDTVYAMMLCAFLWFAIHSYCGLDRKGRYTLTPR